MNSKNKLLLIPSLILILIFPITASAKSIQRFLMECPKTMKAGEQAYCSNIRLLYTDNSTKLISRSSLSNWKTTNSALYVNGNGRLTAQRVTNDTNVTIEAEYNDNGRIKGGFSTTRVIGAGSPFTNFYISCPLRVNENTNFDCGAYATIDGRKKNVTTSTSWREKASYTTSFGYGSFSAGNVNGNSGSEIIGSYTYGSTTRSDNKMITIVDGYVPPHQKYLTKVLLKCSDSLTEGSSTQCTAIATLSDNSTINASPLINCKGTNSYASVTSSGKVTASQVTGNKNYSLECGYTYNGKTMYGIESIKIKDKNPKGFTEFRIDCPTPINENTQKQCKAYAKIDGTERNVASSSSWRENVNYASISSTGLLSAGEVSSNSGVYVVASYNYGGVKKEANQIITIKNIETPIESEPETNDKITVNITNRWKQSKITFNGNSEWIFKFISYTSGANSTSARSFSFCEKNRPEYCLNLVTGSLQSSKVSPENKKYAQWTIEDYDNYKRIRNVGYSNYYIHHENNTIQAGYVQSGWLSAQWEIEQANTVETPNVESFEFINKSNNSIKLTVGNNSEWVLTKDTIYNTDAYKICEKKRSNYCLNIEYNDRLQNSKIQRGWYSALWTIKKLPDGSLAIRSKWKTNKFISINSYGITLTTSKNITTSNRDKSKSWFNTIVSLFISNANAELYFGEALINLMSQLDEKDKWVSYNSEQSQNNIKCYQASCSGKDPISTGCSKSVFTDNTTYLYKNGIQIATMNYKWSEDCQTNWTQIISNSSQYLEAEIRDDKGNHYHKASKATSVYTPMLYAPDDCSTVSVGSVGLSSKKTILTQKGCDKNIENFSDEKYLQDVPLDLNASFPIKPNDSVWRNEKGQRVGNRPNGIQRHSIVNYFTNINGQIKYLKHPYTVWIEYESETVNYPAKVFIQYHLDYAFHGIALSTPIVSVNNFSHLEQVASSLKQVVVDTIDNNRSDCINQYSTFVTAYASCMVMQEQEYVHKAIEQTLQDFSHLSTEEKEQLKKVLISIGLDMTPIIGTVKSGGQLILGKDLVTGEDVNRAVEAIGLIPYAKITEATGISEIAYKAINIFHKYYKKLKGVIGFDIDSHINAIRYARSTLKSSNKKSGTMASAEIDLLGVDTVRINAHSRIDKVSSKHQKNGFVGVGNSNFNWSQSPTATGYMTNGNTHAEYKILDYLSDKIKNVEISGNVNLFIELPPCSSSCGGAGGVIEQFKKKFPNITITVKHNNGNRIFP